MCTVLRLGSWPCPRPGADFLGERLTPKQRTFHSRGQAGGHAHPPSGPPSWGVPAPARSPLGSLCSSRQLTERGSLLDGTRRDTTWRPLSQPEPRAGAARATRQVPTRHSKAHPGPVLLVGSWGAPVVKRVGGLPSPGFSGLSVWLARV